MRCRYGTSMVAAQSAPRGIVTPEAVVLELETAGLPSRAIAEALDFIVQFGMVLVLALVLALLGGGRRVSLPTWDGCICQQPRCCRADRSRIRVAAVVSHACVRPRPERPGDVVGAPRQSDRAEAAAHAAGRRRSRVVPCMCRGC